MGLNAGVIPDGSNTAGSFNKWIVRSSKEESDSSYGNYQVETPRGTTPTESQLFEMVEEKARSDRRREKVPATEFSYGDTRKRCREGDILGCSIRCAAVKQLGGAVRELQEYCVKVQRQLDQV